MTVGRLVGNLPAPPGHLGVVEPVHLGVVGLARDEVVRPLRGEREAGRGRQPVLLHRTPGYEHGDPLVAARGRRPPALVEGAGRASGGGLEHDLGPRAVVHLLHEPGGVHLRLLPVGDLRPHEMRERAATLPRPGGGRGEAHVAAVAVALLVVVGSHALLAQGLGMLLPHEGDHGAADLRDLVVLRHHHRAHRMRGEMHAPEQPRHVEGRRAVPPGLQVQGPCVATLAQLRLHRRMKDLLRTVEPKPHHRPALRHDAEAAPRVVGEVGPPAIQHLTRGHRPRPRPPPPRPPRQAAHPASPAPSARPPASDA